VSQSYTAIALESAQLAQNKYIKNPIFSDLTPNDQGSILFSLTFSVDPKFVLYGEVLARDSSSQTGSSSTNTQPAATPAVSNPTTTQNQQPPAQVPAGGVVTFPGASH
jgi:hypothetical protein